MKYFINNKFNYKEFNKKKNMPIFNTIKNIVLY